MEILTTKRQKRKTTASKVFAVQKYQSMQHILTKIVTKAKHFSKEIILTLILNLSVYGISIGQQNYSDSLNIALTSAFDNSKIPGCAIIITNENEIIYQKSFGYADIRNQKPFGFETTTNIASVSKTFISVALMKAIELGYFTLETEISKILPFKFQNPYYPSNIIRIKHLVTHTSGIIDNDSILTKSYNFIITKKTEKSSIELLKEAGLTGGLSDTTLREFYFNYLNINGKLYSYSNFSNNKPGKNYNYSNFASALAAYLIEIKSNLTFSDFTHKYILTPLRMEKSDWYINNEINSTRAILYYNPDLSFPFYTTITYPDGGFVSSASELSFFVQEMLKSKNGSSTLLKNKTIKKMFRPFFKESDNILNYDIKNYNNGVFWELYPDGFIGHPGGDPGVSCFIEFNNKIGIVFLGNSYIDTSEFKSIIKKYATKLSEQ
jgi:CubicO group peptidase (beta-lactamase class C family)